MTSALATIALSGAAVAALIAIGKAILGVYRAARRIESTFDLVEHELKPNSGSSLRDAVDRIEIKADNAVGRAEEAASNSKDAAEHAAEALARIERLEKIAPAATAIIVNPAKDA